jgi:hypothetical protein
VLALPPNLGTIGVGLAVFMRTLWGLADHHLASVTMTRHDCRVLIHNKHV